MDLYHRAARFLWHLFPRPARFRLGQALEAMFAGGMNLADSYFDWRYGVATQLVRIYTEAERMGTRGQDPTRCEPTHYLRAFALRRYLRPTVDDIFIDLGCGTGRVLFVFAKSAARAVKGVDFEEAVCAMARKNIRTFRGRRDVISVERKDCAALQFDRETIIFLNNPFGVRTLQIVLENIRHSVREDPRPLRICFFDTPLRETLDQTSWLTLEREIQFFKNGLLIYRANNLSF